MRVYLCRVPGVCTCYNWLQILRTESLLVFPLALSRARYFLVSIYTPEDEQCGMDQRTKRLRVQR